MPTLLCCRVSSSTAFRLAEERRRAQAPWHRMRKGAGGWEHPRDQVQASPLTWLKQSGMGVPVEGL